MQRIPRRLGKTDRAIMDAKTFAIQQTMKAHTEGKAAVMGACYGAQRTELQKSIQIRLETPGYRGAQYFTERGDFTHLAGRGV
ncbi:hypothetical protein [Pseudomonas phage Pf17397_F_PD1]|nr:hypothetical protein [Pseudomonas phage Pf17397_F_PD1]